MDNPPNWESVAEEIDRSMRKFLAKIYQVWDETGLSSEVKTVRFKQVSKHLSELTSDMLQEAEESRQNLVKEVQDLMNEATSLSKELQTDVQTAGYEHLSILEIKSRILNKLQKLRAEKQHRLNIVNELLKKELEICKALGTKLMGIDAELPSESELKSFKLYLEKIEAEKKRLEAIFKETQKKIIDIMLELRITPSTDFEYLIYDGTEDFILTNANMTKLRELHDRFKQQLEEAKQEAIEKKKQLQDLWKYLEEPAEKCQEFLDYHIGYDIVTLEALDEEIKRCKERRSENIAKYVTKVRSQIEALWDQCQIGNEERKAFHIMGYQTFTEDLLTLHEMEVERLQKYYKENRGIFELLEVRDNLWQKMENLEHRANDPNRFHNRGGQLLLEEKERNVIQKKLPKIEEEIRELVEAYELKNGKPFTTNGVPLGEALKQSWEDYVAAKQVMIMARKQARDQSGISKKTPLSVSKRTPLAVSMRRPSPATSAQKNQTNLTPFNPSSRKRRNQSSGSNRANRSASKLKRRNNSKAPRRIFLKSSQNDDENQMSQQMPASSSTSISSYGEFQEHLENRDELRSSVLPARVLKNANHKVSTATRIKTPIKPLRKNFTTAIHTPRRASSNKLAPTSRTTPRTPRTPHTPRSPSTTSTSRLAPAPGTLPFIF